MSATANLAGLGLILPPPPRPIGNYVPFRLAGNILYLSGVGPRHADGTSITGKVGAAVSVEQGYEAAKLCGLNLLTNMIAALGSLDRVDTVLKVLGVFGDNGRPARSAVGMGSLPGQISVEIEAIVLVKN